MANIVCRMKDRLDSEREIETQTLTIAPDIYCNKYVLMNEDDITYIEVLIKACDPGSQHSTSEWDLWRVECISPGAYVTVRINEEQYHHEMGVLRAYAHGKQS